MQTSNPPCVRQPREILPQQKWEQLNTLAEVWFGDRRLERQLKRQKNSPKFCPICANRSRRGGVNHAAS